MNKLKLAIHDEKNDLDYVLAGAYYNHLNLLCAPLDDKFTGACADLGPV